MSLLGTYYVIGTERGMPDKVIRLLVADDLAMIRQGVRMMLAPVEDLEIIGEASTSRETDRLVHEARPDVVLVDQDFVQGEGLDAIRQIREAMPNVEVVVMADRIDEASALEAIEAGAMGYILKDVPANILATALRAVCNGEGFFHPEVTRRLADRFRVLLREKGTRSSQGAGGLTKREFDTLIELAKGSTYNAIAAKFVVNVSTVKTHVQNIFRKLGCRNRSQVVAYVLRNGLIK